MGTEKDEVMTVENDRPHQSETREELYVRLSPRTAGTLRILRVGGIRLELDAYRVCLPDGQPVALRRKEHDLLRALMEDAGRLLTRRELLDRAWGPAYHDESNTLTVHIRRLRHVLGPGAGRVYGHIRTVRRTGYVFTADEGKPTT